MSNEVLTRILTNEQAARYAAFNWSHEIPSDDELPDPSASWGLIAIKGSDKTLRLTPEYQIQETIYPALSATRTFAEFGTPGRRLARAYALQAQPFTSQSYQRVSLVSESSRAVQEWLLNLFLAQQLLALSDQYSRNLNYATKIKSTPEKIERVGLLAQIVDGIKKDTAPDTIGEEARKLFQAGIFCMRQSTPHETHYRVDHLLEQYANVPLVARVRYGCEDGCMTSSIV